MGVTNKKRKPIYFISGLLGFILSTLWTLMGVFDFGSDFFFTPEDVKGSFYLGFVTYLVAPLVAYMTLLHSLRIHWLWFLGKTWR